MTPCFQTQQKRHCTAQRGGNRNVSLALFPRFYPPDSFSSSKSVCNSTPVSSILRAKVKGAERQAVRWDARGTPGPVRGVDNIDEAVRLRHG